jgi:hypothetical protein
MGYFNDLEIPNLYSIDKMHTTLVYCDNDKQTVDIETVLNNYYIELKNPRLELLGEEKNCLALVFDSEKLTQRHTELLSQNNLYHGWPSYTPHITISIDLKGFDFSDITSVKLQLPLQFLKIEKEVVESINKDWK